MSEATSFLPTFQQQVRVELEAVVLGELLGPDGREFEDNTTPTVVDRHHVSVMVTCRSIDASAKPSVGEEVDEEILLILDELPKGGSDTSGYGWTALDFDHGFHETMQSVRFTISAPARREFLERLLTLNHERYAEKVKQGLHGKKGTAKKATNTPKKKPAPKSVLLTPSFFGKEDE